MKGLLGLSLVGLSLTALGQTNRIGVHPPKLVLLISIDQFRQDYIERFAPYYLPSKSGGKPGGFRFLMETGARYLDAHHNHIPTATGPGHASLMSGSEPTLDGIIGNDWFDRVNNHSTYCVDDASVHVVGGGTTKPMSAKNLLVSTVGDELKLATGGKSKVVGISFKDRAAILMAGHAADTVIWLDSNVGNWVSSSYYFPNDHLPNWVDSFNKERVVDKAVGQNWEPLLPSEAYSLTRRNPGEAKTSDTKPFSHRLGTGKADKAFYKDLPVSGNGQEFLFKTVERAVDAEKLGQHECPDVLVVNLATNDYVGHRYGPDSPEVMDVSVRTDRLLSELFTHLDKQVGIDNVDIVLTADHGVLPVVEESAGLNRMPSVRITSSVADQVATSLSKQFGEGKWLLGDGLYEQNLFLDHKTIADKGLKVADVEKAAAEAASNLPGVYMAFTRSRILNGEVPGWDWTQMVLNGYNPRLGGDIMVIEAPGALFGGGTGTSHGTAWAYDSHVPILLRGPGITKGIFGRHVHTADIASTLCHLLGIEYPTGNIGHPLSEALGAGGG